MYVLKFFACIVLIGCIKAKTLDDLKNNYLEMIVKCTSKYPITDEDLELLKTGDMGDKESTKCLFACVYKKTGMMDDKGMLDVDQTNKIVQTYFSDNSEELKKGLAYTEACKSVNDAPVTDGDRGCDRAALLFKCTTENLPAVKYCFFLELNDETIMPLA
ncbi:odorant binding protein 9 [Manduca sexta]|uniref:Odorant binding protein 9 n=1 Tax=Manduca sexta TaxID=7130 RepID=A0A921YKQ9_MANSE|nr:odorant binding protein 9 [Manduca sexta]